MTIELKKTLEELTETAILGTNRRPPGSFSVHEPQSLIESTLVDIDRGTATPEAKLLDKLTTLSLTRKSGQIPRRFAENEIGLCPKEEKRKVSDKSLSLLKRIIEPESKGGEARRLKLIEDWLEACVANNLRVPSDFVPRLLDAPGLRADQWADQVAQVCGNRFHWLAQLNPQWQRNKTERDNPQETFESGDPLSRINALNQWRRQAPGDALKALEKCWPQESGERANLLKCLATQLSLDDEPFLEEALKERRKEVRTVAAQLLAMLPSSRFIARMEARAAECFTITKDGKLSLSLPETLDEQAARDGIADNLSVGFNLGKKAGWLVQFLSFVNPRVWLEKFALKSDRFLQIVFSDSDWQRVFEIGLIEATGRYKDLEMMAAIVSCDKIHLTESQAGLALLKLLPAELLEEHILKRLPDWSAARGNAPRLDLWYYLEATTFSWSENFTRAILGFIIKECGQTVPVFGPTFTANAGDYALRMHLGAGELIEQVVLKEARDAFLPNALERLTDTFKMRLEIASSFATSDNSKAT